MSTAENKALARRFCEEVWNKGNLDAVDELLAPDHIDHEDQSPRTSGEGRSRADIKQGLRAYRTAFPDVHMTIEDQIAEGDRVVSRWVITGTQTGPLGAIPPSGKRIRVTGIWIDRIAHGKVVESWENFDGLGLLRQLGAWPALEPTG